MAGRAKRQTTKRQRTKSQKATKEEIIENLKTGMTIEAAALLAGVCRQTYYNYREKDSTFAEEADQASRWAEAISLERIKQTTMDSMDWTDWAWILEKQITEGHEHHQN